MIIYGTNIITICIISVLIWKIYSQSIIEQYNAKSPQPSLYTLEVKKNQVYLSLQSDFFT